MNPTFQMKQLLSTQSEPSDPRYQCFNTGGVEIEVGEFLYGLCRMIKPYRVLETGTHKGIGASYIGQALADNNAGLDALGGHLTTLEFIRENIEEASELLQKLGLQGHVNIVEADATTWEAGPLQFELIFLDTEPQTRFAELLRYYDNCKPGGFILIHDLHPHMHQIPNEEHGFAWPYGEIPEAMRQLIVEGKLRPVHFRTPRGLTLFYKPGVEDYAFTPAGN